MKKKKLSKFAIGLLIYIGIAVVAIIIMDAALWRVLTKYQKSEELKLGSKNEATLSPSSAPSPTPEPTNTPTPTLVPTTITEIYLDIPSTIHAYIDGEEIDLSSLSGESDEIDPVEFADIKANAEAYSEYSGIYSESYIPVKTEYKIRVNVDSVISFTDGAGNAIEYTENVHDEDGLKVYEVEFTGDDADKELLTDTAFEFIKLYSLFITGDREPKVIEGYFPSGSEYYKVIASLDNDWYARHNSEPVYSDEELISYVGYSDSLACVTVAIKQSLVSAWTGQTLVDDITHPIWFAKIDGEWKIAAISH